MALVRTAFGGRGIGLGRVATILPAASGSAAKSLFRLSATVPVDPQLPRRTQRASQDILGGRAEPNVGYAHPSPAARYRQEDFG
jgi:hypothetical protein